MIELVEYIGPLGTVLAVFNTIDACASAATLLDCIYDGNSAFICHKA